MATAPTSERGHVTGVHHLPGWDALVDDAEHVPELTYPASVAVYDRMRSDAQVAALTAGLTLPIRRWRWELDPNGADPTVVDALAADLGLPVRGEDARPRGRRRARFSFAEHLFEVLKAPTVFGHAFFEQVGEVDDAGWWRLRKLAPRPQRTITAINVEADGGLAGITQTVALRQVKLPVARLVAYSWERDPGQWQGRSMLRPLYRDWLVKDRLVRINTVGHDNAAVGTPYVEPPPNATDAQLDALHEMAEAIRRGDGPGVGVHGAKLHLLGITGTAPDVVASMRYHDEQMARAWLMMFLQLGQTQTGSRALGETMTEYVRYAQEAIADWLCDVFTGHVIEDWVDWNVGEDAPAPALVYDPDPTPELALDDLRGLIDAGAVRVDAELEAWVRERHGLPAAGTPRATEATVEARLDGRRAARGVRAQTSGGRWREPTEREVRAAVDFDGIEARRESAQDTLVALWAADRERIEATLLDQVEGIDSPNPTAYLDVDAAPPDAEPYAAELLRVAEEGAEAARAEAAAQGVTIPAVDVTDLEDRVRQRAEAVVATLTADLVHSTVRRAVELAGDPARGGTVEALRGPALRRALGQHLGSVTAAGAEYAWGSAVTGADNLGRFEAFDTAAEEAGLSITYIASELLDKATCDACREWDGHVFASMADANAQYPWGQNKDCAGGGRCRGTIFADYGA